MMEQTKFSLFHFPFAPLWTISEFREEVPAERRPTNTLIELVPMCVRIDLNYKHVESAKISLKGRFFP